jgi:hypothetical protein
MWKPPSHEEEAMQFVLLIYQGTSPTPTLDSWSTLSEQEQKRVYAEYAELNKTRGLTPGLPLGLPKDATTVRVRDGKVQTTEGPFVNVNGAVGGYFVLEADNLEAAVRMASRIPAARLGGAIEVRPVAKYW